MAPNSLVTDERIGLPSGLLKWGRAGDDFVSADYRIRRLGPGQWETTCRGRVLRVDPGLSKALAGAEHHHRERQRIRQITRWGSSAVSALLIAFVVNNWITSPLGLFAFAAAVWAFLGSAVRCLAAVSRSLLDPYRQREPWEPPDWWNPHMSR